jgi:NADP-dependent 3-hydroxy acid dehydrogenase YdfG
MEQLAGYVAASGNTSRFLFCCCYSEKPVYFLFIPDMVLVSCEKITGYSSNRSITETRLLLSQRPGWCLRESIMSYTFEPQSLDGKSIIITGGTTGIGRSTALRLARDGANVLIFGRHEQELHDALQDIQSASDGTGQVHGMTADQSKHEDVQRIFQEADAKWGGVDILVNNAALAAESIMDSEFEEWQTVVNTNLLGYMDCCRHAIDRMQSKGEGHIVNIGSLSAKVREKGSDVYTATKAAIEGFSESLRKQVNEKGIKISLIEPGLVGTDMTAPKVPVKEQPEKQAAGEMLRAEDIAECVYYTLIQPKRCDVILVQIRPHQQAL